MESNWTSSLRKYAFPELPIFNDQDSCSDFTYNDATGILAALLDIPAAETIFLEVKASKGVEDGFVFSPKQFKTVRNT
jgi:hypothetical protein